jgi:hypothetical protein
MTYVTYVIVVVVVMYAFHVAVVRAMQLIDFIKTTVLNMVVNTNKIF